jgi:hypothetical protein
MPQAMNTISQLANLSDINQGDEFILVSSELSQIHQVIITLNRECRGWVPGSTELEIQQLIYENSCPGNIIIYSDGSVQRGVVGALWQNKTDENYCGKSWL